MIAADCYGRTYEFFDKVLIINELAAKSEGLSKTELYRLTNEIYEKAKEKKEEKTA